MTTVAVAALALAACGSSPGTSPSDVAPAVVALAGGATVTLSAAQIAKIKG